MIILDGYYVDAPINKIAHFKPISNQREICEFLNLADITTVTLRHKFDWSLNIHNFKLTMLTSNFNRLLRTYDGDVEMLIESLRGPTIRSFAKFRDAKVDCLKVYLI